MSQVPGERYIQPAEGFVVRHLDAIDAAGGDTRAVGANGSSVMVVHFRGRRTGKIRRLPLIRVEHNGTYAAFASNRGADRHPQWYHSLIENDTVSVHDGADIHPDFRVRELGRSETEEAELWWERAIAAYPEFAEYREATSRDIPVILLEPSS